MKIHWGNMGDAFVICLFFSMPIILGCFTIWGIQTETSTIIDKTIVQRDCDTTYIFAMANGDVVDVSYSTYVTYEIDMQYTYEHFKLDGM
jgi:hypothetical protein